MADPIVPEGAQAVPPKSSGSNKTLIIILAVVGVLVVLPIIGFVVLGVVLSSGDNAEKLTEKIIESSSGADVDINSNDGEFTIKTEDGEISTATGQDLLDSFPSSVPVFNSQEIITSYTTKSESGEFWSVAASTNSSAEDVRSYMKDKLSAEWESVSQSTFNGISTDSYKNGDLSVLLSVTPGNEDNDNKTQISYTVTKEQE